MAKVTTMKELIESCKSWKVEDGDGFKEIVSSYLAITGNQQRVLADEFEAAISTVSRWASGHARPRPRMQREIIGWISKRAAASVSKAPEASYASSSWTPPATMVAKSS